MARNQRAATQSEQAKNAAAIAAAESKEDDEDPPAAPLKKKRGRPKKDTQSQPKGLKAKPAPSEPPAPVEEEPEAVDIEYVMIVSQARSANTKIKLEGRRRHCADLETDHRHRGQP